MAYTAKIETEADLNKVPRSRPNYNLFTSITRIVLRLFDVPVIYDPQKNYKVVKISRSLEKQGKKNNRVIDCLLQVRIAQEENKFGLNFEDCDALLQQFDCTNVRIRGLMGMASFTTNQEQIEEEFRSLQQYYNQYQSQQQWDILSMGMSGDYSLALTCGSNMIRVGSSIFGARN